MKLARMFIVMGVFGAAAAAGVIFLGKGGGPKNYARLVGADTVAYGFVKDVGTLKSRVLGSGNLKNADPVQKHIDAQYGDLIKMAAGNLLGTGKEAMLSKLADSIGSIHMAVPVTSNIPEKPQGSDYEDNWTEPLPVFFIELRNVSAFNDVMKELDGKMVRMKTLEGVQCYDFTALAGGDPMTGWLMDDVLVVSIDSLIKGVMNAKSKGLDHTLADSPSFKTAYSEYAPDADVFLFADIDGIRRGMDNEAALKTKTVEQHKSEYGDAAAEYREEIERRHKRDREGMVMFDEYGAGALAVKADGKLMARVWAAEGKDIPAFICDRPNGERELLKRIPANAAFAMSVAYGSGKETRKSFSEYLKEKTGRGVSPEQLGVAAPVADLMINNLDKLESDVVVMAQDFWVAAIPVKSEMALYVAPDKDGRWGLAAAFDWESKDHIDKLCGRLFKEGERAALPWKTMDYEGLKIIYLDGKEIAQKKGTWDAELQQNMAKVQLEFGYAIGDKYAYFGTVNAIKEMHKPSGKSFSQTISYDGIEKSNAGLYTFNVGPYLSYSSGVAPVDNFLAIVKTQIADTANYSVTLETTKKSLTLCSNIPFTAIGMWCWQDKDKFVSAMGVEQMLSGKRDNALSTNAAADIMALRGIIEMHIANTGLYPQSLWELKEFATGQVATTDPWGNPYQYAPGPESSYKIWSWGMKPDDPSDDIYYTPQTGIVNPGR